MIEGLKDWAETNFPPSNKTECEAGIAKITLEGLQLFDYVNNTEPADLNISTIIDYLFNITGDI